MNAKNVRNPSCLQFMSCQLYSLQQTSSCVVEIKHGTPELYYQPAVSLFTAFRKTLDELVLHSLQLAVTRSFGNLM